MPVTVQESFAPGTIRNVCFMCGSAQRTKRGVRERVIDLHKTVDYEGHVFICESCGIEIGHALGMLTDVETAALRENYRLEKDARADAEKRAKAATEAASLLLKAGQSLGDDKANRKAAERTQEAIKGFEGTTDLPSDYPDGRDLRLPPEKVDTPDGHSDVHTEGARAGMLAVEGGDPSQTDDPKDSDYPDKRDLRLDPSEVDLPDGHHDDTTGDSVRTDTGSNDETDNPADADEPDMRDIRLDPSKVDTPDGHSDDGDNQQTPKREEKKELREAFEGTEGASKVTKKAAAKKKGNK